MPPPADQRMERDRMIPASKACSGRFSRQLLEIVDWCLRLNHLERPQSVFALQKALSDRQRLVPRQTTWLGNLRQRMRELMAR
jgi:hypothetical protein